MKLNFCTLFNSNYLSRGLVTYNSLKRNCKDFHLYVFAFDDKTYDLLRSQNYPDLTVISLTEFEDEALLKVKKDRTSAEYCWTSTPSTILYCLNKFEIDNCTYIDADLQFFSDPKVLFDEMGDNSVMITEHRYTPVYDQSATSGKYCVQFVSFKKNERGLKVLNWWRNACLDWCYARQEDGKFGDQKYLDDWTTRFEGVHELKHLGGGIAPWNVQQYTFDESLTGIERKTGLKFESVFFHFHGVKFYKNGIVSLTGGGYDLSNAVKNYFYAPYLKELNKTKKVVNAIDNSFDPHGAVDFVKEEPMGFWKKVHFYFYDLKKSPSNLFGGELKRRLRTHHHNNKDFN